MRIESDLKLDFKDVLIRPKRSTLQSRSQVSIERGYAFRYAKHKWQGVPVIAANMDHTGTFEMAQKLAPHKMLTALTKFRSPAEWEAFYKNYPEAIQNCMISAGANEDDFDTLKTVLKTVPCPFICLDVANGYTEMFVEYVRRTREAFPDHIIVAGNVVTGEMAEQLILSGADIVKVGIGPGSVCTTRKKTGIGYPQLSAVIECADAAHGVGGQVCSDGGCTVPGDVAKAFGGGADFVMLGGMFAGHDECEGEIVEIESKLYKRFYGMSSKEAMERHRGKVAEYRASEGKCVNIPYRGPVQETIQDILGGLRSACTYVGARRLKDLPKCTTFIRVTQQLNEVFS